MIFQYLAHALHAFDVGCRRCRTVARLVEVVTLTKDFPSAVEFRVGEFFSIEEWRIGEVRMCNVIISESLFQLHETLPFVFRHAFGLIRRGSFPS